MKPLQRGTGAGNAAGSQPPPDICITTDIAKSIRNCDANQPIASGFGLGFTAADI